MWIKFVFLVLVALAGCNSTKIRLNHSPDGRSNISEVRSHKEVEPTIFFCRDINISSTEACSVKRNGDHLLILGNIATPDGIYKGGDILISPSGIIQSVGCNNIDDLKDVSPTIISCPSGIVSPGLINSHDHLTYNQNAPAKWGAERFDHRHQWREGLDGHQKILANPATNPLFVAWAELRQILAGTTSVAGNGGYKGLLRNLDMQDLQEGLNEGIVKYQTFPLGDANGDMLLTGCDYPDIVSQTILKNRVFLPHVAEGITQAANNEIACLGGQGINGVNLISNNTALVHAIGATALDGYHFKQAGSSVVWSPRSNIALYGNTTPVTMYDNQGINIALSTDWTVSGSTTLLREMKCADYLNKFYFNQHFSDRDLWLMATANAANALKIGDKIGQLKAGYIADIAIFDGSGEVVNPYRQIIDADATKVLLVLRGGMPLFGESEIIESVTRKAEHCERISGGVCGTKRSVCLRSEIGISFRELEIANKDSYGLIFCDIPPNEPTCKPFRRNEYTGIVTPNDTDGDGIQNFADNCQNIFNPIIPLDNGKQPDCDGDGIGDVCDTTPLEDKNHCVK